MMNSSYVTSSMVTLPSALASPRIMDVGVAVGVVFTVAVSVAFAVAVGWF